MSCCTDMPEDLATATLDPAKHVNYVLGMILGEDDFKQEFSYLSGRDQWLARDLIGYGTVRGLGLRVEWDGAKGPRIYVDKGAALTPAGQQVCVPSPQCAHINAWLKKHADEVQRAIASPPDDVLPLYVLLCYRECPVDNVPIPGEPCRTEDQLVKPSRLRDDFLLDFALKPPMQREERALKDFCKWLREIDMSDATVASPELGRFLDEIRHAAAPWYSPPASPPIDDFLLGSPPAWLRINPADACAYLRAAFDLWVTELRPKWLGRWYGCAPDLKESMPQEDCVLLGEVRVRLVPDPAAGAFKAVDGALPSVDQSGRPYLLHLRLLQEWLMCGPQARLVSDAGPRPVAALVPGGAVVAETSFGLRANAGSSMSYARADHTHGTPTLPALAGDASGTIASNTVNRVRGVDVVTTGAAEGQILRFRSGRWQPEVLPPDTAPPSPGTSVVAERTFAIAPNVGSSAAYARADHTHGTPPLPVPGGDLGGTIANASVNRVRGVDVITTGAANGMFLAFNGSDWVPTPAPSPTGQFVTRGAPQPYAIVAAGAFEFQFTVGNGAQTIVTSQLSSYNKLANLARGGSDPIDTFYFSFTGLPTSGADAHYIVKLTPWWSSKTKAGFVLYFAGFSALRSRGRLAVKVAPEPGTTMILGNMMIEVSEI